MSKARDGLFCVVHAQGNARLVKAKDLHLLWLATIAGCEHHLELSWLGHVVVGRPVLVAVRMPALPHSVSLAQSSVLRPPRCHPLFVGL